MSIQSRMPLQSGPTGVTGSISLDPGHNVSESPIAQSIGLNQQALFTKMPMLQPMMHGMAGILQVVTDFSANLPSLPDIHNTLIHDESSWTEASSSFSEGTSRNSGNPGIFFGKVGNTPFSPVYGAERYGGNSSNHTSFGTYGTDEGTSNSTAHSGVSIGENTFTSFPIYAFGNSRYCGNAGSAGYSFPFVAGPDPNNQTYFPHNNWALLSTDSKLQEPMSGQVGKESIDQIQGREFNGTSLSAMIYNAMLKNPDKFHAAKVAMIQTWSKDKLYRRDVANHQKIMILGIQMGFQHGRTMQQMQEVLASGSQQALNDFKQIAKNHTPAMLALGATMAGAILVCPFLGGLAASTISLSLLSPQQQTH